MSTSKLSKGEWLHLSLSGLFFCLLCLGQLQRWQITPTTAIYGHDFVVVALLLLNWRWWQTEFTRIKNTFTLRHDWLLLLLGGWIVVGWILAVISGQPLVTAFLYTGRLLAYAGLNWQLLHASWWSKALPWLNKTKSLLISYWLVGLFLMLMGYLQYFLVPDIRFLGTFGWDVHLFRLVSVQLDPNVTGALLVLTLLLTLDFTFLKQGWRAVTSLLLMGSIALTYSRSTFGAVVMGLVSWAFFQRHQRKQIIVSLGLVLALAGMILLLPRPEGEGVKLDRVASGVARVEVAQSNLSELTPREWLMGRGLFIPGNFTEPSDVILGQHAQLADNILILVLNGLGVGGLVLLVALLYRYRRGLSQVSPLAIASILAILGHSQFNNTLFQPFVWLFLTGIILTSLKYQDLKSGK